MRPSRIIGPTQPTHATLSPTAVALLHYGIQASPTAIMSHEFAAASLFNLQGQVAVGASLAPPLHARTSSRSLESVTGGGTGLGIMAARALAANGMRVYITGRRKEVLDKAVDESGAFESGGSIVALQMDVTDRESILSGVKAIEQKEEFISLYA